MNTIFDHYKNNYMALAWIYDHSGIDDIALADYLIEESGTCVSLSDQDKKNLISRLVYRFEDMLDEESLD